MSQSSQPTPVPEKYRAIAPLDAGGMGQVSRGVVDFPLQQRRPCAIKSIKDGRHDARSVAMFVREAMISWDATGHPNIVNTRSFAHKANGDLFLAVDQEGPALDELFAALPTPDVIPVMRRIAQHMLRALGHLQQKGIVHCDISPANILLGRDGNAKLCDFGLARRVRDPARDVPFSLGCGLFGVPAYASPEVLHGNRPTNASDRYSLGATLYHLLCDELPYGSGRIDTVAARMAQGPHVPLPATVPADLASLISGLLEVDPRKRLTVAQGLAILRSSSEPRASKKTMAAIASEWIAEDAADHGRVMPSATHETPLRLVHAAEHYVNVIMGRPSRVPGPEAPQAISQAHEIDQEQTSQELAELPTPDLAGRQTHRSVASKPSRRAWPLAVLLAVLSVLLVAISVAFYALQSSEPPARSVAAEQAAISTTVPPVRPAFPGDPGQQTCIEPAPRPSTAQPARNGSPDVPRKRLATRRRSQPDAAEQHVQPAHAQPSAGNATAARRELRPLWPEETAELQDGNDGD